jgi:hypothetical protein
MLLVGGISACSCVAPAGLVREQSPSLAACIGGAQQHCLVHLCFRQFLGGSLHVHAGTWIEPWLGLLRGLSIGAHCSCQCAVGVLTNPYSYVSAHSQ